MLVEMNVEIMTFMISILSKKYYLMKSKLICI